MADIKTKKIVDLYRKILDPMGYTVVLKETSKEAELWEPENKEAYLTKVTESHEEKLYDSGKTPTEEMIEEAKKKDKDGVINKEIISSIELEKKMQELKQQSDNLKKVMEETRQNAIRFMNTQSPNELTSILYTGAEGKAINGAAVKVFSNKLTYMTKLVGYLVRLKKKKIAQEILAGMKEKDKHINRMRVHKEATGFQLQIGIE